MNGLANENILENQIMFHVVKHTDFRTSERSISRDRFHEYISNVANSDNWNLWLGLHTTEDGDFDLNIGDEQPKYRVYDPKTKITSILFFWRINMHDIAKGIRRISVLTAWNGRPVGPSKKNLKKNKFHKWKTSRKLCNQINKSKMSYFCLLKGVREG
mgnify:FL=1|tara:strand:- start:1434 stop:1907 length:474 start_codon:yes stop_codon:yes gene_type:complete